MAWAPVKGSSNQSPASTIKSLSTAAASLQPKLGAVKAAPLLSALGSGNATIDVPLKAGEYTVRGVSFTVKPGTVARVNVQVRDGELVPVSKGDKGTSVKIDPPLDLPLWLTGRGVELQGAAANLEFEAELGGFFDLEFTAQPLSKMLAGGPGAANEQHHAPTTSEAPSAPGLRGELGELASQMLDLSTVKVDAKLTLRESEVDIGGVNVKIDPSTTFSVKGDGKKAIVSGHVALDEFKLQQGGVDVESRTGGTAELSASLTQVAGGYQLDSRLSAVNMSVDNFSSVRPSAAAPGQMDRISLGPTELRDGEVRLSSKLGIDGLRAMGMSEPTVSMSFKATGVVDDVQLSMKDAKDSARASVRGNFSGSISLGSEGAKFDAMLTNAHVTISDLQQNVHGNSLSIERAVVNGDLHFNNTAGSLQVDGEALNVDIVVDDYKGSSGGAKGDLGRTTLNGDGKLSVGAAGVQMEGRMKGSTVIDSASFSTGKKAGALGSSTVSGEMTKLELGKGAPSLRLENVAADIAVKRTTLDLGQTSVSGAGRVKASGTVELDASGFSLDGKGQVSMMLDDGQIHSSTVDLALGRGSVAELNITQLDIGKTQTVKLGPGSKVDAILAGGTMKVAGKTIELEKGGRAQIAIKKVDLNDGKADLRGSVKLDAKVKSGHLLPSQLGGVKVEQAGLEGRVKLSIDDVHLGDDRLTFKNAQVSLEAKVGKYVGLSTPGQPGIGSLQEPVSVVSAADVKKMTAAQLAGVTAAQPVTASSPVEALKLLKDGDVRVSVPMHGAIHALGTTVVKFPQGTRLDLSLAVRDGKVVAKDTKATLSGGATAIGVKVLGVHLDEKMRLHADLKVAGRAFSVPVPGVKVPGNMTQLAELAALKKSAPPTSGSSIDVTDFVDLAHAQLDVSNATFRKGTIKVPGGSLELAEGSKLSFHGTPVRGELTGSVKLNAVNLTREDVALKGSGGRADLRLSYRREGDKALVDGALLNLAMSTNYVVRKAANGDYVSLGAGKMSGGSVSLNTEVALDANGLPKLSSGTLMPSDASVNVPSYIGELKAARMTSDENGAVMLGASHVEGAVGFSQKSGLTLKATVDSVDAELEGARMSQKKRPVELNHARLKGRGGSVEISPGKLVINAKHLAWDATVREVKTTKGPVKLKANQVHVSGVGRFTYDSKKALKVEGKLLVDGKVAGDAKFAKTVTADRKAGLSIQR